MAKITDHFRTWLDAEIRTRSSGCRLPPYRALAERFSLSPATVQRIMHRYAAEKKLERIPGKGTFIPSYDETPQFPVPDAPLSSVDTLVHAIQEAISRGDFRKGTALPQLKFITIRYEVSYRTAIKAFKELQNQGLIHQVGKRYWVGSPRDTLLSPENREMYLVTTGKDNFAHPYQTAMGFAYQKLEKELHENGFQVHYANMDGIPELGKKWRSGGMPAGIIIAGIRPHSSRELYSHINRHLPKMPTERPPILLDLRGTRYKNETGTVHRLTRGHLLTVSSRAIADLIRRKRFRQVIIFMNTGHYAWAHEGQALPLFRIPWIARDLSCTARFRITVLSRTAHPAWNLPASIKTYSARQYQPDEEKYAGVLLKDALVSDDFAKNYAALAAPDTLWVFNADADAIKALEWAKISGISIPDDLSVIGLENDPRFYHWGLSYCGPDWEKIGYQMAHAVIGDVPVARTGRGFIRTSAVAIEKLTTR